VRVHPACLPATVMIGRKVFEQRPLAVSFADGPKLAPKLASKIGPKASPQHGDPSGAVEEGAGRGAGAGAAADAAVATEDEGLSENGSDVCDGAGGNGGGAPSGKGTGSSSGSGSSSVGPMLGPGAVTWEGSFVLCSFVETCMDLEVGALKGGGGRRRTVGVGRTIFVRAQPLMIGGHESG
jgi:hypothetical protein